MAFFDLEKSKYVFFPMTHWHPCGRDYCIMKTAQDSCTIQIVRFQERMHPENFKPKQIQNGQQSAIILLDTPEIG